MGLQKFFSAPAAVAIVAATAVLAVAACGGGGGSSVTSGGGMCAHAQGYGGGGGGGGSGSCASPSPSPTAAAQAVGLLLTGENPVANATYGMVDGFFKGTSSSGANGSNVVNLTAGQNVVFTNVEAGGGLPHTASFIQTWGGSFPANPPIPSTAAAAGTSIGSGGFSTGNLNPGQSSAVYTSGGSGQILIFGCAYHYGGSFMGLNMRTVIIVM